jgi:hypothetical protein
MIGGYVTGPVLIAQSDRYVLAVRQVLAYPTGVEVEIEAHAHGPSLAETPFDPTDFSGHRQLLFRLRLADGSQVALDDEAGLRSGNGPTLMVCKSESSSGGPDNSEHVRQALWMSPLPPPPGLLTLTCSWPNRGLEDADLVLDADAILTAAHHAQPFWREEAS